jgi:hypothetical protein
MKVKVATWLKHNEEVKRVKTWLGGSKVVFENS